MRLRSGIVVGGQDSSVLSRVPTQGSGTRSIVGNLESLRETSSTDSQSFSGTESEMESYDNASTLRKGKFTENPFDVPSRHMEFKVKLTFRYQNVYGAEIYEDPLGRYVFKTIEHRTPFSVFPMVNYQGDLYMGQDGARYEVTRYPQQIDTMGVLQAGPMPSQEETLNHGTPTSGVDGIGTSTKPHGSKGPQQSSIDKLFDDLGLGKKDESPEWNPIRDISVVRVSQDNTLQEVFKDSSGVYYATTRLPHLQFLAQHTLILEKSGLQTRIRDHNGNQFRAL